MLNLNSLKNKNIYQFSDLYFNYLDLLHVEQSLETNKDLFIHQFNLNHFKDCLVLFNKDVQSILAHEKDKKYIKKYKKVSLLLDNLLEDINDKIEFINTLLEELPEN